MIDDYLCDLLSATGGKWEGTLAQLCAILGPLLGISDRESLREELKACAAVSVVYSGEKVHLSADVLPFEDGNDLLQPEPQKSSDLREAYYETKTVSPDREFVDTVLVPEATKFLEIIRDPGEVVEIRGLRHKRKGGVSGWFDDMALAAQKAVAISPSLKGTYFTLNPVNWLSLSKTIGPVEKNSTDMDVTSRRWLLIDIEGRREKPGENNASDAEVEAALEVAEKIRKTTVTAKPLCLCSGNGCHLLYRIELENTQESTEVIKRALYGLAAKYNTEGAEIDARVSNASRISKLPGTYTGKGENTIERPCRWARVLSWDVSGSLPVEQLSLWGQGYQSPGISAEVAPEESWKSNVDPVERAKKYLEQRKPAIEGQGGDAWTFDTCALMAIEFSLSDHEAEVALSDWNSRCSPPWSTEELREKIANARKYGKGQPGRLLNEKPTKSTKSTSEEVDLNSLPMTDLGNAEALIHLYGRRLRWYSSGGYWLWWSGRQWEKDTGGKALSWANKTARARRKAAEELEDEEQKKRLIAFAYQSENSGRRDSMLAQFKAYVNHVVQSHQLDRDPWALNCANGTLNLKTGELRKHEQTDLCTKIVQCEYDPAAECPRWLSYLDRVMGSNQELISYLKRAVGYTLTGSTCEHAVFICHGHGRNGKSLFLKILSRLLGEYSRTAQSKTFQDTGQVEAINNSLARLDGARLCIVSETSSNYKLDEAGIKSLSGQDMVTARFLHQEFFEFQPQFKIWIASNYKPLVTGADLGIWRRLKLIPWAVTISEDEDDTGLDEKLFQELPGILKWAVDGCLEWQQAGRLREPPVVSKAIEEYRYEQDTLSQFLSDRCSVGSPEKQIDLGELYAAYLDWAKLEGHRNTMHKQTLSKKLKEKGFEHYVRGVLKRPTFRGIALKSDDPHAVTDSYLAREAIAEIEGSMRSDERLLDLF